MAIKLLQTADPDCYKPMLEITAKAARKLCELHTLVYDQYVGIKRGFFPWQAAFNRIPMLTEIVREGHRDWVIYLDADAYPFELSFDVAGYLDANRQWGVIGASGGDTKFKPNSGILLFNLADPRALEVVEAWQDVFDRNMPDAKLRESPDWVDDGDQRLLHEVLAQRGDAETLVKIEGFDLIGWPESRFLRQVLRVAGSFDDRCETLRQGVAAALLMADFGGRL